MFPSSGLGESWERIFTKVDSSANYGLDKLLSLGGFRVGKNESKPSFTPVDNCDMKTGNQCRALVIFKPAFTTINVPLHCSYSQQHLRESTRRQRFAKAKPTKGNNWRVAIVSGPSLVETCWPLRDSLWPQEPWLSVYQQRILVLKKAEVQTTSDQCQLMISYIPLRFEICRQWLEFLRRQVSRILICRQHMVPRTEEEAHPSGPCQALIVYKPRRIEKGVQTSIKLQQLKPAEAIKVQASVRGQKLEVSPATPIGTASQPRIRSRTVINRQTLVHVLDPTLFCYALEHALQVPKYLQASRWLFNKYLGTDSQVERLTRERDDALRRVQEREAWYAESLEYIDEQVAIDLERARVIANEHGAKILRECDASHAVESAKREVALAEEKAERERFHAAELKQRDMAFLQRQAEWEKYDAASTKQRDAAFLQIDDEWALFHATETKKWETASVQTNLEWTEFHAAEMKDRDADFEKQIIAMANDFTSRLHAEQEKTRATQFIANSNFERADTERVFRAQEYQISHLREELKQVRLNKKNGEEQREIVLGVHKGFNEKLRTQVQRLEGEMQNMREAHDQKILAVQKDMEGATKEVGRLSKVNELLRDRLGRIEGSEARKTHSITDLSQQVEKSTAVLDKKTAEMENVVATNEQMIADLSQ